MEFFEEVLDMIFDYVPDFPVETWSNPLGLGLALGSFGGRDHLAEAAGCSEGVKILESKIPRKL